MTAVEYNRREIAEGNLTFASLPASLAHLVAGMSVWVRGERTLKAMPPEASEAFARAVGAWQEARGLVADGCAGPVTRERFAGVSGYDSARAAHSLERYTPASPDLSALLDAACDFIGVQRIGNMAAAHHIIRRESGGWVGRPNYRIRLDGDRLTDPDTRSRWPSVWAAIATDPGSLRDESGVLSTACGLGQLLAPNMRKHAPDGVFSLGDPLGEAIAFIRYVLGRYQAPGASVHQAFADAWEFYELPRFRGKKADRPKGCVYGWQALARYGGPGLKPGEGY